MNQRLRLKLTKLIVIILSWMVIGFLIGCYDYIAMKSNISLGPSVGFSLGEHLFLSVMAGFLGAIMGGSFLVFFVNEKYRDKPYGFTIAAVVLSFIIVVSIITIILGLIAAPLQTGKSFTDAATRLAFYRFISDPIHVKNIIFWSPVVALTQIMLQFNTKFGEGSMWNLVRGKYQIPQEEKRIFMFVDLNSSTTIAENLGNETYHQLLKDFFADITNPILDNKGEIYQYVGDEVVIAWKYEEGILKNRCLECFFDMKKNIQKQKEKYIKKYGRIPEFKAGLHCGKIIAGEVGIIKRDITFSGDVLNTTSRIQGKCKEYQVELIASSDLLQDLNISAYYTKKLLGIIKLRGKEKEIELLTVSPIT